MKPWTVLDLASGRAGNKEKLADIYDLDVDSWRRYCREPLSDESPTATGRRSPLDRIYQDIDKLLDAHLLVNPPGAEIIAEDIALHVENHLRDRRDSSEAGYNIQKGLASIIRGVSDLAEVIPSDPSGDVIEQEIAQLVVALRDMRTKVVRARAAKQTQIKSVS